LKFPIGLKTCSPPLFHSEFLHFEFGVIDVIPKNISDISQKRPIGLLTLNHLPLIIVVTFSALSGSTRIGLFEMKPKTHHLDSMSLTSWSHVYTLRPRTRTTPFQVMSPIYCANQSRCFFHPSSSTLIFSASPRFWTLAVCKTFFVCFCIIPKTPCPPLPQYIFPSVSVHAELL
jgi:hypothetical protein